ncbi:Uncharacterised protein [Burkholderia oklahomensis]|nr:serine-type carboxypeptidase family protein [Burkholderia oklahomensis C6786]SUW54809.1 Uncharacterised protein [Burkholderia oklahomensis]
MKWRWLLNRCETGPIKHSLCLSPMIKLLRYIHIARVGESLIIRMTFNGLLRYLL